MRFYQQQHRFCGGVDLHARGMDLCVLDPAGQALLHRDLPAEPRAFLDAVAPYRDGLVVAVECMFTCTGWRTSVPSTAFPSCSATPCT
jgi:hypothetical protein